MPQVTVRHIVYTYIFSCSVCIVLKEDILGAIVGCSIYIAMTVVFSFPLYYL